MITSIESYYVHSSEIFHTFHRMFYNMPHIICHMPYIIFPRNVWRHSPEYLATFLGMFEDIPRNVWRTSECLRTFPGMFEGIPLNVWPHSSECLATFLGMFEDIPPNIAFPVFLAFSAFRSPFLYSWFYT